jgi:hypothetical protein
MLKSLMQTLRKLQRYQIVRIKWNDIISDNSGWVNNQSYDYVEHAEASKYESVGYYITKDKKFIFLSMSANPDADISGMMLAIPFGTIRTIEVIG